MAIDVNGLRFEDIPDDVKAYLYGTGSPVAAASPSSLSGISGDTLSDLQNAAILLGGVAFLLYEGRPRGDAQSELLDIRKSTIPNANLGVFAKSFIPEGTVIGLYPGYPREAKVALESSQLLPIASML